MHRSKSFITTIFVLTLHSTAWAQTLPLCNPTRDHIPGGIFESAKPEFRLFSDPLLAKCKNIDWYSLNDSPTVFVFVHGLGSNSATSWLDEDSKSYWPEIIRSEPRFEKPSIFIAGYPTSITGTDPYSIRHAANTLFDALNTPVGGAPSILSSKKNIVFIGHSLGGVVVRHMLSRVWNVDAFKDKAVGLALIASPSVGSKVANAGNVFLPLFGREFSVAGRQLQWHTEFLSELHDDFLYMKNRSVLPHLKGFEVYEAQFVMTGGPQVIVEKDSAARYFEANPISGSDHWTIAKPNKAGEATANTKLLAFFLTQMKPEIEALAKVVKPKKVVLMDSYAHVYSERSALPGEMNSHVIKKNIGDTRADIVIEPVHFNWNEYHRVVDQKPDLVIIHRSALASNSETRNANDLRAFLNYLLRNSSTTKVIVYGRGKWQDFAAEVRSLHDEAYNDRVLALHVKKPQTRPRIASFNDGETVTALRGAVRNALAD